MNKKILKRLLDIVLPSGKSAFLWGPRKSGKSYWLNHNFNNAIFIDLLKTDIYAEYATRPSLIRERYSDTQKLIIIDEIQMIPELLNEIHWLIENKGLSFVLTGSSARKLRKKHANLLGGRAYKFSMCPLTYIETEGFDIEQIMVSGLLAPHFLSENPIQEIRSYVADYLKEEIALEAAIRNMPSFAEFLKVAAITSGELLNYTNVGRECGIKPKVVKEYFEILEDTLLGFRIQPWTKRINRRLIETEKFYLFDVGISNYLAKRKPVLGSSEFGKSFEHFILMELKAYQAYKNPEMDLSYWRTSNGYEVDFILGEMDLALEIKSSNRVHEKDINNLLILNNETKVKRSILVCMEEEPRILKNIEIIPWKLFLTMLWGDQFLS